jgi:hypothetical protein
MPVKKKKWYENKFVEIGLSAIVGAVATAIFFGVVGNFFKPFQTMRDIQNSGMLEKLDSISRELDDINVQDLNDRLKKIEDWKIEEAQTKYFVLVDRNGEEIAEIKEEEIVDLSEELEYLNSQVGGLALLEFRVNRLEDEVDKLR